MASAPAPSARPPALALEGIDKRFGTVHANRAIDLVVPAGTIHGIIGENGAGKSTLMNIVYGFYQPDSGRLLVDGRVCAIRSPQDAIRAGIGMVHQHFMLVEPFTVLENLLLGAEGGPTLEAGIARARSEVAALERDYGLEVPLDARVADLPVGVQQRVEILKALFRGARTLILDEPTGVLTPQEADHLFRILRSLRAQGRTILLITHKLREIMAVTDQVSVMRQGSMVAHRRTAETSKEELAELMVGRKVLLRVEKRPARPREPILEVQRLEVADEQGVRRVKGVSFAVRAGEIVGIAGVSGNGQQELMAALSGEDLRAPAGSIKLFGQDIAHDSPRRRRKEGLHFVPEERLGRGAVPTLSLAANTLLTRTGTVNRSGWIRTAEVTALAENLIKRFNVKAGGPDAAARSLSGGNLQKFIVGREIDAAPKLLIVSQPTWGVDVGAAAQIRGELLALRDKGCALLVVSEELDELFEICDRLVVIAQGRVSPSIATAQATIEMIGEWMSGLWNRAGAKETDHAEA